jgi:hypothetical protein
MAVSPATCHVETFGMRLIWACGVEHSYAGVDASISICPSRHAHYQIVQTQDGFKVEEVDV